MSSEKKGPNVEEQLILIDEHVNTLHIPFSLRKYLIKIYAGQSKTIEQWNKLIKIK